MVELVLINLGNIVFAASALIKTVIRLRLALIVGSLVLLAWSVASGNWSAFMWNLVFAAAHAYQLAQLLRRRRAVRMSADDARLHRQLFPDLDQFEFLSMWSLGHRWRWPTGATLIAEREQQASVMLVVQGTVVVERSGTSLAVVGPGSFIGEQSYLSDGAASATVKATNDVVTHEWSRKNLAALADIAPVAHNTLVRQFGADLAAKLN